MARRRARDTCSDCEKVYTVELTVKTREIATTRKDAIEQARDWYAGEITTNGDLPEKAKARVVKVVKAGRGWKG